MPGHGGGPGRTAGKTMKEYKADVFRGMTDEQKAQWLKEKNISGIDEWKMAEGNPAQGHDFSGAVDINILRLDV